MALTMAHMYVSQSAIEHVREEKATIKMLLL